MSVSDNNKNRGTHGDSSFMLGRSRPSSENPPALAVGSVKSIETTQKKRKELDMESCPLYKLGLCSELTCDDKCEEHYELDEIIEEVKSWE